MMQSDEVPIQRSKWSKAMIQFYDRCNNSRRIGDTNNEVANSAMQLIYNTIRTESSKTNGMQPNAATNNNVMGMFAPARPTSTSVNNFFASFNSKDVHKVQEPPFNTEVLAAKAPDTIKPGGAPVFVPQTTMEGLNSEVAKLFAWVAEINKKVDQMAADGKVAKLSREKLLALRLQPSAKLRPEYLPKVEVVTKKSLDYSAVDLSDPRMPKYLSVVHDKRLPLF